MELASLFTPDLICLGVDGCSRREVIERLVDRLTESSGLTGRDSLVDAIEEREKMASTALVKRVAFPHARTDLTDRLHVALGVAREGIDWGAPHGIPVQIVFTFVTAREVTQTYIQSLAAISALLHRPGMVDALIDARSPEGVLTLIRNAQIPVRVSKCVRDIMVRRVITVGPDTGVREAAHILAEYNISGVPVVSADGDLVGILSERDLLVVAIPRLKEFFDEFEFSTRRHTVIDRLLSDEDFRVSDIMTREVHSVEAGTPIVDLAQQMVELNLRRVPVVEDGKLVGLVGRPDILRNVIRNIGVR